MKEFFRPSWAKVIVALFFPFYFGVEGVVSSGQIGYHTVFSWMPFSIFVIATIALWANTDTISGQLAQATGGEKIMGLVTEVVLPLAVDYVLACAVVWVYKKLRSFFSAEIRSIKNRRQPTRKNGM